ncbi:MAG: hypothetical protein MUE88_01395 [Flavobacteriales bacterium]|nr:hypothetical protein [Flavobacteriales bacterium]
MIALSACERAPQRSETNVSFSGYLTRLDDRLVLVGCGRKEITLKDQLRDAVIESWALPGEIPPVTEVWMTVYATDSSFSRGLVEETVGVSPCDQKLSGTYALDPTDGSSMAARLTLMPDGKFALALVGRDGIRSDLSGTWTREGDKVILNSDGSTKEVRFVSYDLLVLGSAEDAAGSIELARRR